MDMSRFRISLRACRANTGLKLDEFAEKVGVTGQTIQNWENGVKQIPTDKLIDIAQLAHVPIDMVINDLMAKKAEA